MSKELEERVDRLERVAAASGYNIHEFDSAEQAAAWTKELEAAAAEREKIAAEARAKEAAEAAAAELALAEAVNRAAAEDLKTKKSAAATAEKGA